MKPHTITIRSFCPVAVLLIALFSFPSLMCAQFYSQTNLVSNGSLPADVTDSSLVNPWGMVQGPSTPFWVSDQVTNKSTLYMGDGTKVPLSVSIPAIGTGPANGPTGVVFNTGTGFSLPTSSGATVSSLFMFANLNGEISGWNPGSTGGKASAVAEVTTPGAAYTGLAINATGTLLYAANYTPSGGINIFNDSWVSQGKLPPLPTSFHLPSNYEPYNVADINGTLFLAEDPLQTSGPFAGILPQLGDGNGAVIEFNPTTRAYSELVAPGSGDGLNVPWGFAMAPSDFGKFSNDLLAGNFGSGWISAYNPISGQFLGYLDNASGARITDGALWTLVFGNGAADTNANTLYLTAGITHPFQTEGLMASITATPEPATSVLLGTALLAIGFTVFRRRQWCAET